MKHRPIRSRCAFTLIELLVVVAIIALLLSILLPSLHRARENSRSIKCLANLRSLGQGVVTYTTASLGGTLPGGLHPAVYMDQGLDELLNHPEYEFTVERAQWWQNRYLTHKLSTALGDTSSYGDSLASQISTCPTAVGINPVENFTQYYKRTGHPVHPTYYALNNYGPNPNESIDTRVTEVPYYFGYSRTSMHDDTGKSWEKKHPPKPIEQVKRPADEWMIADGWYREAARPRGAEFRPEGPYQVDWTGFALPNFAPHGAKGQGAYIYTNEGEHEDSSEAIQNGKLDGKTNTVFFDGHGAPVKSKEYIVGAGFKIMYGYPGTVNPARIDPPEDNNLWKGYWK